MDATPTRPVDQPAPARVLVVDDDASIRMLLEVTVGFDPRFQLAGTAASGTECLQFLRDRCPDDQPDLVLLDVTLPDADGIELLREVRSIAGHVRVALFTGWSDDATLARAREAGADAIYRKDGRPGMLLDGLADLCAGYQREAVTQAL